MDQIGAKYSEWARYLNKQIFKGTCPVCVKSFNGHLGRHVIAHVGSCNFNGPNLSNGFLRDRNWAEILAPFTRLTSQDMMACEVLRCSDTTAIVVWVEVDLALGGDQYLVCFERIDDYDLSNIETAKALLWVRLAF